MTVVTPDLSELFEEAFERAGLEMRTGYDLRTVRRKAWGCLGKKSVG